MDQLRRWNRWYDEQPELLRFPIVIGLLVIVGAINLALTISTRFPFGLLVLLAVLVLAAIRLPYLIGLSDPARADWSKFAPAAPARAGWSSRVNRWYESFPELWRFQLIIWGLVVVGAINMALTLTGRFPFGLLVLLAIIVVAAIRMPYVGGWGRSGLPVKHPAPPQAAIEQPPGQQAAASLESAPSSAPLDVPPLDVAPPEAALETLPPSAAPENARLHTPPDDARLSIESEGPTPAGSPRPA